MIVPFAVASYSREVDAKISIVSQLFVSFIASYAILGVEQCSLKLEQPYGLGASCLPQEAYCNGIFNAVYETLDFHKRRSWNDISDSDGVYTTAAAGAGAEEQEGATRSVEEEAAASPPGGTGTSKSTI